MKKRVLTKLVESDSMKTITRGSAKGIDDSVLDIYRFVKKSTTSGKIDEMTSRVLVKKLAALQASLKATV